MSDKNKKYPYGRVDKVSENAAMATRLPGWQSGPADAFRHIVASAEMTRRHSAAAAWLLGEANEQKGNLIHKQSEDDLNMDRHNNEIGRSIGRDAKSFDEIVERAKAAIDEGVARDGSGAASTSGNSTPIRLPQSRWGEDTENVRDRSNWPPTWKEGRDGDVDRILARPVADWSDEDVRAVQNARVYWRGDGPARERAFGKVRQWYEARASRPSGSGGAVFVHAYARSDGTQVAGHSRGTPHRSA